MTKHFKIHPTEELFEDYIKEENTIGYPRVDYIEEDKKIWRSRITPKIDHSREYLTFRTVNGAKWESLLFFIPSEISTDYVRSISYSIDNGDTWITTNNVDEESVRVEINSAPLGKVLVKGDADQYGVYLEEEEYTIWCSFGSEQLFNVSGNIMSLFYGDNFIEKIQFPEGSSHNCCYLFSYDYENWEYICNIKHASGLVLPSTELTECCYEEMFYDCTSLIDAPELPAITLASYCYSGMFDCCSSLRTAPNILATTLAKYCYSSMFSSCTSLTTASELPATTLAEGCYGWMFYGCTSLIGAPELPATTLAQYCYSGMFGECSSLTIAPELPATTLATQCYSGMFNGCTSLNYIKALFIELPSIEYTKNWVWGVNGRGTFIQNGSASWWLMGHNGIPNPDWTLQYEGESTTAENAKASALDEAFTVEIVSRMSINFTIPPQIQKYQLNWIACSINNGDSWSTMRNVDNRSENLILSTGIVEPGTKIVWLGSGRSMGSSYSYSDRNCRFSSTWSEGDFKIKGKLVSLLGGGDNLNIDYFGYTFSGLFQVCYQLTDASELVFPSGTAYGCYSRMFESCNRLVRTPELPATILNSECYAHMFYYCSSLIAAPKLPATTLTYRCYYEMFKGCTHLKYINMQAINISASSCLEGWTTDVSGSGVFVKNPLATWNITGNSGIPSGWTEVNEIEYLESVVDGNNITYINTGISTKDSMIGVEATCQIPSYTHDKWILGYNYYSGTAKGGFQIGTYNSDGNKFSAGVYNSENSGAANRLIATGRPNYDSNWHHYVMNALGTGVTIDGTEYSFQQIQNLGTNGGEVALFRRNGNLSTYVTKSRISKVKLYEDDTDVVRDFIPVRSGSTGYMCDKKNGQLYGNAGTGSFILGDDLAANGYKTDGLVLYLDGIDKGTTSTNRWIDLVGGKEFTEANGNNCHGENRIICSNTNYLFGPTNLVFPVDSCTIECAVNLTKSVWGGILILPQTSTYILTNNDHYIVNDNKYKYITSLSVSSGGIATISFAKDVAVENGTVMSVVSGGWNSGGTGRKATIGCLNENGQYKLYGDIYAIRVYNRLLTTDEMLHNQRVDNKRFNLGLTINGS